MPSSIQSNPISRPTPNPKSVVTSNTRPGRKAPSRTPHSPLPTTTPPPRRNSTLMTDRRSVSQPINASSRPAKSLPTKKPAPKAYKAPPSKTTTPVPPARSNSTGNWLNRSVQNSIAGVGDLAGGIVTSIGDGVNRVGRGVGDGITSTTRSWGQGVAGYGNQIKDSVGIGGPRMATAGNPLGLAGQGSMANSSGNKSGAATSAKAKSGDKMGGHLGL